MKEKVLQSMSFEEIYTKTAVLAKELEVRWFHSNNNDKRNEKNGNNKQQESKVHNMPFLRRSLQYIEKRHPPSSHRRKSKSALRFGVFPKYTDLLFKLFRHRTIRFNEALLPNARRATRTLVALNALDHAQQTNDAKKNSDDNTEHNSEIVISSSDSSLPSSSAAAATANLLDLTASSTTTALPPPPAAVSIKSSSSQSPRTSLTSSNTSIKKKATTTASAASSTDAPSNTVVFYHYFHTDEDKYPALYFELRSDKRCPFCFFNAGSDYALIMHCNTTHFDGLSFDGVKDENDNLHIAVRAALPPPPHNEPNTKHTPSSFSKPGNFTYIRPQTPNTKKHSPPPTIPTVTRPIHRISKLDSTTRKKKARMLEEQEAPAEMIAPYLPTDVFPNRQYYHSRTNLPMLEGDWDYDSDDEPDDIWYHRMGDELMEDFDDVSAKEKTLMKMWNHFIKVHTTTADKHVPSKCITFIQTHLDELKKFELRQNLLLHLLNLWDSGLISSRCILSCMEIYDGVVEGDDCTDDGEDCEGHENGVSRNGDTQNGGGLTSVGNGLHHHNNNNGNSSSSKKRKTIPQSLPQSMMSGGESTRKKMKR